MNWPATYQHDIDPWVPFSTICPDTLSNGATDKCQRNPRGQQEDRLEGKRPALTGTFESTKESSWQQLLLKCAFGYDLPPLRELQSWPVCPSVGFLLSEFDIFYLPFPSCNCSSNPVLICFLLPSILFPLISFPLPIPVPVAISPHK